MRPYERLEKIRERTERMCWAERVERMPKTSLFLTEQYDSNRPVNPKPPLVTENYRYLKR